MNARRPFGASLLLLGLAVALPAAAQDMPGSPGVAHVDKAISAGLADRNIVRAARLNGVFWSNRPTLEFPKVWGDEGAVEAGEPTASGTALAPAIEAGLVPRETVRTARSAGVFWAAKATAAFPRTWGEGEPPVAKGTPAPVAPAAPQPAPAPGRQVAAVAPSPAATPAAGGRKRIVAVMEIEDKTGRFKGGVTAATEYLRGLLNAQRVFVVVDKGRQEAKLREMLAEQKKESYKECYDTTCQIPLGQAVAADMVLRTTLSGFANFCVLSSELIDLAKEASEGGGLEKFDCSETGLGQAIDRLLPQFVGAR